MNKNYRIFISHSWKYSNGYNRLKELLDKQGISYFNHSVPPDDKIHTNGTDKALKAAIESKVKGVSCVLILAGVYASYSKWIKKEIKIAKEMRKPIIAIKGWGATKTSAIVKLNANEIVKWQGKSIAKAIKKLC